VLPPEAASQTESPMRELGVRIGTRTNPKLTHGAEMPTNYPAEALLALTDTIAAELIDLNRLSVVFRGDTLQNGIEESCVAAER